ncbi:type VII secretion integral membrane protein EccD [Nonomuraea sp. NPDC059194]|uniref:type VII secretion integral membrane protein EccD n=1 Tax=Nonomuraea sp. NPDC059194 TaxID=3346764 RepID=UPI0036903E9E
MKSLAHGPSPQGPMQQGALAQIPAPIPALCHVTIVGPRKRADLALPADIPLPHVLPGLLRAMDEVGGEATSASGWMLQRLGGPPLDIGQSLGTLGVLDGEVLYLRPREAILPPALYDDVADVVAGGVKDGSGKWTPDHTRLAGTASACGLLVMGALALYFAGPPWTIRAIVAGVLALLLLVTGAVMSRAIGDSSVGAPIGWAALPYGFLAGLLAPGGAGFAAPNLLAAFACTALVAAFGGTLTSDGLPGFLGTAIASVTGSIAAAVVMIWDAAPAGVAAVAATVLLAFTPLVPTLAFRMAKLPLPTMPTSADELRSDDQRVDAAQVKERTVKAQSYLTSLIAGVCLVAAGAQFLLVLHGGWAARIMVAVLAITLIMRARVFHGLGQRIWLLVAGLGGLAALGLSLSAGRGDIAAVAVGVGLLWVALIAAGLGTWLPTGKPSPFWGRAGDIVDLMLIAALFPLALGVLDVYTWVRGLSG